MASYVYLASAAITVVLAVIVFVATARGRDWNHYTPRLGGPRPSGFQQLAGDERVWVLGFVLLVLATSAGVLSAVQGGSTTVLLGVFGLVVVGFVTVGVYALGRSRGHPHAYAVGEAVVSLGFILLVAVGGQLLTAFGA